MNSLSMFLGYTVMLCVNNVGNQFVSVRGKFRNKRIPRNNYHSAPRVAHIRRNEIMK